MSDDLLEQMVREAGAGGAVFRLLPAAAQADITRLSPEELRREARRLLERPVPGEISQGARLLLNPCLAVQWGATFEALGLPRALRVFEPCTGSSEPILLATEIYSAGQGEYVSVNLNQPLAAELRPKLERLQVRRRIIEDDATTADLSAEAGTFDVACFHHALNDLLQTAVAEARGLDTRTVDWWAAERQMIEWLGEEAAAGRLGGAPRQAVLGAMQKAVELLKPGGVLLCDHWTWEAYREVAWFPWELFQELIPLARAWVREVELEADELTLPDRDPQWWLALRKR